MINQSATSRTQDGYYGDVRRRNVRFYIRRYQKNSGALFDSPYFTLIFLSATFFSIVGSKILRTRAMNFAKSGVLAG